MSENKHLKTGLDSLLPKTKNNHETIKNIEVENITPGRFQPRSSFEQSKMDELSESIKKHGILSPIIVRQLGLSKYEIIAGERRYRAAITASLNKVPCLVKEKKDQDSLELALIENLQRENLNPVEEARGYHRLKNEFGLTQDEVSKSTGKPRSSIANSLRLLNLPNKVLDMLEEGSLEKGHAKILASMDDQKAIKEAERIAKNKVSVREFGSKKKQNKKTKQKITDTLLIEEKLSEAFGHPISIDSKSKNKGSVSIKYNTDKELDIIISKILNK